MHTIATVLAFLKAQRESDEPDAILEILKQHDGKPLTKRLLPKLPGGEERWRIIQHATMTHLETRDYGRTGGNTGIHLLMAYQTTSVVIDAAWVEEHNPAYFKGRRERNEKRDRAMSDSALLQSMAHRLNSYATAKARLDEVKVKLDELTSYEAPFSPDSYEWERMCGAREDRS
jgi:hypothetical protein